MTGLSRWARARWGCRIQCPTVAAMTPISNRPASTHTTTANGRNPGTRTGRPAAAVATIEVPITDANQLGPTAASASRRSSRAARKPRPGERPSVGRRTVVVGAGEVAVTGRASAARPAPDHPGSTDCGWPLARPFLISHPLAGGASPDSAGPEPRRGGQDTEPLESRSRPWSLQELQRFAGEY